MRRYALRRRYGRSARPLKWASMPGVATQSYAMTSAGAIYTVTLDSHKRKWVATGPNGMFLGSAIRKGDAQRIAEKRIA
jgi:hypothetical protein